MKKLLTILTCILTLAAIMVSCSDEVPETAVTPPDPEEPEKPEEPGKQVRKTAMNYAWAQYLGQEEGNGLFTFDFNTTLPGEDGKLPAGAEALHLVLYSDIVPDEDLLDANIDPGRYEVGETPARFKILKGSATREAMAGSYYSVTDGDGVRTDYPVLAGEVYLVVTDAYAAAFVSDLQYDAKENLWVSCEYDGAIDIEPIYNTIYSDQKGWYWGDDEWDYPGIGEYMLLFYDGEFDGNGLIEGTHVTFNAFEEMAPEAWAATLPTGTYMSSTEYALRTFRVATDDVIENERNRIWAYAAYQTITDGVEELLFIRNGAMKASRDGDTYTLKLNMELENGERHLAKYTGALKLGDEFTKSTFVGDREIGELDFGYLVYDGPSPMWNIEGVNRWSIRLYNDGLTVYPDDYWGIGNDGEGEYIIIEFYTDSHYTTDIPTGRYAISDEEVPYHAAMGEGGWGFNFGTWYYDFDKDECPAKTGDIQISKTGDEYTIEIEFVDDRGNNVTGQYVGQLTYRDEYVEYFYSPPAWMGAPDTPYQAAAGKRLMRRFQ